MKNKLHRLDNVWIGFGTGVLLPIIGFFLIFLFANNGNPFSIFWYNFTHEAFPYDFQMNSSNNEMKKNILILCLILNLIVFYLGYFTLKFDQFTKGIVAITLLLVGLSFIFIY
ncbi:MAG: hypothetical protein ACJ0QL_07265 [Parvicellaceae bacterium]